MNRCPVSIPLLFLCFLPAHGENQTHFTGQVLINCGSSGTSAAVNGRQWLGDVKPKFLSLLQIKGSSSTASTVIRKFISVDPVPHRTARISRSKFSYEFQVNPEIREDLSEAGINLAKFDWYTIEAATNQFSSSNKIGQGGFGLVYKGVLPAGQLVVVKRLSPSSIVGLPEFKNEILLLPNLQHRNIIKLLGYCIHREEKILVYEFMENRSLKDTIRDGPYRQDLWIQWSVRFKAIMGIARGLVYLHQDSRLKLIHRTLHFGNILFDSEMNPKISNFFFARTLAEHQSESEDTEGWGIYGYMAPEYCMHGKFSVKSDVYSFGIIVMLIVRGSIIQRYELHNAWKLWNEGKALDLVDESLGGEYPMEEALRCIKIGLLCIEEKPDKRPTMPSVIKMLEGYERITQEPQEPWSLFRTEDPATSRVRTDGGVLDSH